MELLFSYGTLQQEDVQLSTYGRVLEGTRDSIVGYAPTLVKIEDRQVAKRLGRTHHDNVVPAHDDSSRVHGTAFELTEAELSATDVYESPFLYSRVVAALASGRKAWVYVYSPDAAEQAKT